MSRKYTSDKEREVHQDAVKLRKMTDKQLIDLTSSLYMKGFNEGLTYKTKEIVKVKDKILTIKGIGPKTHEKISLAFEEI
jgi:hypothetical protein